MNGSLRMHKSYTNNSNHTIKIPSNVNEYFSVDNNLKLDYSLILIIINWPKKDII